MVRCVVVGISTASTVVESGGHIDSSSSAQPPIQHELCVDEALSQFRIVTHCCAQIEVRALKSAAMAVLCSNTAT